MAVLGLFVRVGVLLIHRRALPLVRSSPLQCEHCVAVGESLLAGARVACMVEMCSFVL